MLVGDDDVPPEWEFPINAQDVAEREPNPDDLVVGIVNQRIDYAKVPLGVGPSPSVDFARSAELECQFYPCNLVVETLNPCKDYTEFPPGWDFVVNVEAEPECGLGLGDLVVGSINPLAN